MYVQVASCGCANFIEPLGFPRLWGGGFAGRGARNSARGYHSLGEGKRDTPRERERESREVYCKLMATPVRCNHPRAGAGPMAEHRRPLAILSSHILVYKK